MSAEQWRKISGWHYEVSDYGHVRRRPTAGRRHPRLLPTTVDANGYLHVTLVRGDKKVDYRVDTLICTIFHGKVRKNSGLEVEHLDGVTWNNWASNLRWSFPLMATEWYCGPIMPACRGLFRFGPYANKTAILPHVKPGDVIVAKDNTGAIKAFEFMYGRDSVRNPFDLSRYWRCVADNFMEVERVKGLDMVIEKDVVKAAAQYREIADMHPNYAWAMYLHEAAYFMEEMARMVYGHIAPPPSVVLPNSPRRHVPPRRPFPPPTDTITPEPVAPAPITRRRPALPAPVPSQSAPIVRRRPAMPVPPAAPAPITRRRPASTPAGGFFNKG